ncbi:hypothetical protein NA23_08865 [Fervidobacterium islandicum]|uniref:Uncharacterized protein n=1 Tax=Fervidobacterium islandicum TaxID=2423 RepID=A0AAI8GDS7_FERIS|nr:hypothetical protein [Fervidobacterium islandicum]AMW33334.1 hypothetical protein NA23_08865 [Fervidobacterium islandicum]
MADRFNKIESSRTTRSKKVAFLGIFLGFLFVFLYIGSLTPSKWTFLIVASYLLYGPYLIFDSFFMGLLEVFGLNVLAYLFIPRIGYVTTFAFISFYIPIRYLLERHGKVLSWVGKYVYFNCAFFIWLFVQGVVLDIDILSQTAQAIQKVVIIDEKLVMYGIVIFANVFFAGYEILFEKVVLEMKKWIEKFLDVK